MEGVAPDQSPTYHPRLRTVILRVSEIGQIPLFRRRCKNRRKKFEILRQRAFELGVVSDKICESGSYLKKSIVNNERVNSRVRMLQDGPIQWEINAFNSAVYIYFFSYRKHSSRVANISRKIGRRWYFRYCELSCVARWNFQCFKLWNKVKFWVSESMLLLL